ncbi:MAG TPA: MBL fold metallo-hydrolase [Dehalococcoidia bacterium]
MELAPNLYSIPAKPAQYTGPHPPNVYLVRDGDEGAFIDSGFADDESVTARLEFLRQFPGLRLRYVVITHTHLDHAGGAYRYREATGAQIVMHRLQEEAVRKALEEPDPDIPEGMRHLREAVGKATPDVLVEDGQTLQVGSRTLRVVHTPGHQAGHICIYLEDARVLFTGDHVVGEGTVAIPPPPSGDMAQYLRSLEKVLAYPGVDRLCPGHGPVVENPQQKVRELIQHRLDRERQILALVRRGKDTVTALRRALYPELDKRLYRMAEGQVLAHLRKLEAEGTVTLHQEEQETRVTLTA